MTEPGMGSVTHWIADLKKNEDTDAQRKIWERFVDRLVRFANRKLQHSTCRVVDADDIANMAFANFFQKSPEDFEQLVNRNDLWQILVVMAERRVIDQIRKESSRKHGGGRVVTESMIQDNGDERQSGLDGLAGNTIPPDFDLMLLEEAEGRLNSLPDEDLRQVAVERMQGLRNREIADKMSISLRSVERKVSEIRDIFRSAGN